MGLFSGIGKIIGGAIPVVGGLLNAGAVGKANKKTQAAIAQAQAFQQQAYNEAQTNLNPYIAGGLEASNMRNRFLGLGDHLTGTEFNPFTAQEQQAGALNMLRESPLFTTAQRIGQEAVLQNAAATGGVRGGNIQSSLAESDEGLFAQILQNQLAQLGAVAGQGLGAANSLGQFGASNAAAQGGLALQSGASAAGSILGQQNIYNQTGQQLLGLIAGGAGGGAGGGFNLSNLFGGGGATAGTGGINNVASVLSKINTGGNKSVFTGF